MPGASELFVELRKRGIKIGLGSGLPRTYMNKLIEHVGWSKNEFDYISSSEDLKIGRPNPIMIYDFIEKLKIKEKDKILKIGDTVADIKEGKNAGVLTIGVLTSTTNREVFEKHQADFVLNTVNELLDVIHG